MENQNDGADISNTAEDVELDSTDSDIEESTSEADEETAEELRARLAKAEELANNYKVRAEKAESKAKKAQAPQEKAEKTETTLSTKDIYALMEAKVPQEDIGEVEDYARLKKVSIGQALQSPFIKALLSENAEKRNVAIATNTGNSRRGSAKVSDETLLSNARSGKMPESEDEIERLIRAQYSQFRKK